MPPGGTVLDPFIGSGTTAMAAKELGFNCIGIELLQHNYEITLGRLADGEF
jgi:site-specific DNA-methyltransferase (adenine-specific)